MSNSTIRFEQEAAMARRRAVVTTVEQSKHLQKLGVRPEIVSYTWVRFERTPMGYQIQDGCSQGWVLRSGVMPDVSILETVPAFSTQDLLDLLKQDVMIAKVKQSYACFPVNRVPAWEQFKAGEGYKGATIIDALYFTLVAKLVKDKQ